eukprot:SAG25_NODE_233_length_11359_cov_14.674600_8_plen_287_part_00
MPPPRTHRARPTWCPIVTEWPPSRGAAVWGGRSRQAAMIRVAIDSEEGKKCAPPAMLSDSLSAPIDPDFQQGCSGLLLCCSMLFSPLDTHDYDSPNKTSRTLRLQCSRALPLSSSTHVPRHRPRQHPRQRRSERQWPGGNVRPRQDAAHHPLSRTALHLSFRYGEGGGLELLCAAQVSPASHRLTCAWPCSPPRGWRSWNLYGNNVNQTLIEGIMDGMVKKQTLPGGPSGPTSLCDLGCVASPPSTRRRIRPCPHTVPRLAGPVVSQAGGGGRCCGHAQVLRRRSG